MHLFEIVMCFLGFATQNLAESCGNYFKKLFLGQNRHDLKENVQLSSRPDLSDKTHP